ncbi:MAG: superoxide dismutase [Bdellovibrionales bacterium]
MPIQFPPLPFDYDALEPYISADTLKLHHDKHHKKYVDDLNDLVAGTAYDDKSLEDIIHCVRKFSGDVKTFMAVDSDEKEETGRKIFNFATQAWNHNFFWHCLERDAAVPIQLEQALCTAFGSIDGFKEEFAAAAKTVFGSGWAWLAFGDGKLQIIKTGNGDTPLAQNMVPLLTCDVWEHAYYVDYQNRRPDYVTAFVDHLINWDFVLLNYQKALAAHEKAA